MKKAVLAVSVVAVLLLGWRLLSDARDHVESSTHGRAAVDAERTPDGERDERGATATLTDVADVTERATITDEAAAPDQAEESGLVLSGVVLHFETEKSAGPRDVTLRMYGGFDDRGDLLAETTVQCDAAGNFRWEVEEPGRTVTFAANAELREREALGFGRVTARLGSREEALRLIVRQRLAAIYGTVFDPEGAGLPGATVRWNKHSTKTDSEGRYEIAVLKHTQDGVARCDGFGASIVNIQGLGETERRRVDFALSGELQVRGTVRDAFGAPLPGVQVRTNHYLYGSAISDAEGPIVSAASCGRLARANRSTPKPRDTSGRGKPGRFPRPVTWSSTWSSGPALGCGGS